MRMPPHKHKNQIFFDRGKYISSGHQESVWFDKAYFVFTRSGVSTR